MPRILREVILYLLIAIAIVLMLALLSYDPSDPGWSHLGPRVHAENTVGLVGAWFADVFLYWFGYMAYLLPVMVAYSGWLVIKRRTKDDRLDKRLLIIRWLGFVLLIISGCALASMHFSASGDVLSSEWAGGVVGHQVGNKGLVNVLNVVGATVLLLALFLASITLFTGWSWVGMMDGIGRFCVLLSQKVAHVFRSLVGNYQERKIETQAKETHKELFETSQAERKKRKTKEKPRIEPKLTADTAPSARELKEQQIPLFNPDPNTQLPELALLDDPKEQDFGYSPEALEALSTLLEIKLKDFNVNADVVGVQPGPVITRFEIQPAPGTKASKITGLAKDLARSMSVVSVRVVEVIPGKSTIGIEIPNEKREIINFQEIIKSDAFEKTKSPLTIGLGKNISGLPMAANLAKMPHLLVAGTTGSGKSVAINAMLLSLLYKATAKEVRMILIDPKMLELNVYEGIPHLLCPVVTDMKDASNALRWSVGEMERRYKLMSQLGVRNLAGFNKKVNDAIAQNAPIEDPLYDKKAAFDPEAPAPTLESMPHIVVVVDEFADMMMVVGKKAEELIARLAQKARAAGIHLVLATQRPSVDVVTGLIKANVPTRIAFQVSSRIDSRTILDQMGAEQLLGHGDMLYYQPGITPVPERVHGAFVDDHEVHNVVDFLKSTGEPDYVDAVLEETGDVVPGMSLDGETAMGGDEFDPLYDQAVQVVTESRKASISYVQRRLRVGYNRAATIVEQMESQGVVSTATGSGVREVLAPPPPSVE